MPYKIIEFPHKLNLRPYQKKVWNSFFTERKKRYVLVWHRRAGKDFLAFNIMIAATQERVGGYYYIFPELAQAKRNIWEGINRDGSRFLDHIPKSLIKRINNQDMLIEFTNGSIFRLCGSDRYDKLMGANPVGVVLSEYAIQNPIAWTKLVPILLENQGWAIFPFTFRGKNHGYKLYENNLENPNFYCDIQTILDTKKIDGSPVIPVENVQEIIDSGEISEEEIQQELYCNPLTSLDKSYFAKQIRNSYDENRIMDFAIDPLLPVSTFWDIGYSDDTTIWFIQTYRNEIRCVNYHTNCQEDISHYVNVLHDWRDKHRVTYDTHWGPHDIEARDLKSGGRSLKDIAGGLGLHFRTVKRIPHKNIAIQMARSIFSRVWFHKTNCEQGINCLQNYVKGKGDLPKHDWASHGADSFLAIGQVFDQLNVKNKGGQIIKNPMDWV